MPTVSFENDLVPILRQFRGSMLWRFDLTRYDDVKANYQAISHNVLTDQMPPPPFPPFTKEQKELLEQWKEQGFPK